MLTAQGIPGTRVLQGLGALAKQYSPDAPEKACETALSHGAYHVKTIRVLPKRRAAEVQVVWLGDRLKCKLRGAEPTWERGSVL